MYYLQSRYYDPVVKRFISADGQFDSNAGFTGYNLYSYCANNPIAFTDTTGFAIETVLDIANALESLGRLITNPTWGNAGYLVWDIAAAAAPFIPASYVGKGLKFVGKVAGKIDDFVDGSKLLKGSYNVLKRLCRGIQGIEVHHLIEKRFRQLFDCTAGKFLSVVLTEDMHQIITNRWRNLHKVDDIFRNFAYGSNYSRITYEQMVKAVEYVYRDMPGILQDTLNWLEKNWKR